MATTESVDITYERDVLACCLRDKAFVRTALPVLRGHHFSDRTMSWIWRTLSATYETTREVPTAKLWQTYVDRAYADDDDADYVTEVILKLVRREVPAAKSALEEIRRLVRLSTARRAADEVLDALETADLDKAEKALSASVGAGKAAGVTAEPHVWAEEAMDRLALYDSSEPLVSIGTGLPTLNRLTTGGMRSGALGLVVANTNVGKSTFAVHLGFAALLDGHAVVHVTTEETEREAQARYDARFTGISRATLLSGRLTAAEREVYVDAFDRRGAEFGKRLIVQELPPGSDVSGVRVVVERARELHPGLPMLVVIDSPDHLRPSRKLESFRLETSDVYWTIKGLLLDHTVQPVAGWATTQAPKAFEGRTLTTGAVSETYDKARIADFMFGLMEGDTTAASKAAGKAVIEGIIVKNRLGGAKKWKIYMEADLGCCDFRETGSREAADEEAA